MEDDVERGGTGQVLSSFRWHDFDPTLRNLLNAVPTPLLIADRAGVVQGANMAAARIFGYRHDELCGRPVEHLVPERIRGRHVRDRTHYTLHPTGRAMGKGRELTALHREGHEFPVEIGLCPLEHRGADLTVVAVVDMTGHRRLEQALIQANARMEEFCYASAHDLATATREIGDLTSWVQDALRGRHDDGVANRLQQIQSRAVHVEALLDRLLQYAFVGASSEELTEVDPAAVVQEILREEAPPGHIEVLVDVQAGPMEVALDALKTVLRHLLSNAYQHHDLPHGLVEVVVRGVGSYCEFAVRDDGPGIPKTARSRIFRIFQTLHSVHDGQSGVGLALTKRLVEAQGGRITLEANEPERGVTFRVWWPRFRRTDVHND